MTDMSNTIRNVRGAMLIAGLFFVVISIVLNAMLYSSFSDNPYYRSAYVSTGIGFDVTKSIMLIVAILLWVLSFYILSTFAWFFWTVLTAISISAGFGFMTIVQSQAESAALLASAKFQAAKADVDNATRQVDNLSQYADSLQAQIARAKTEKLDTQLETIWNASARNSLRQKTGQTVRGQLGDCQGTSWYHRKYCPQIQDLETDIKKQQMVVDNHHAYLAALTHKEAMLKKFGELDVGTVGATSHLHPMFLGMSQLSGYAPKAIKFLFLFTTSLVAELLGSFCILVYGRLGVYLQLQQTKLAMISGQGMAPMSFQATENIGLTPPVAKKNAVPAVAREVNKNVGLATEVTQSDTLEENIATQGGSVENVATTQRSSACERKATENANSTKKATQSDTPKKQVATQSGSIENVATANELTTVEREVTENVVSTMTATQGDTLEKRMATQGDSKSVDPRYEQLKTGVVNESIINLSFKNLKKVLGCGDNTILKALRNQLVREGFAVFDATRKCIPVPRPQEGG